MALKKEQKKEIVKGIKENIDKQKSVVFVGIKNIKAKEIFDLRNLLKKADCLLTVAKKTLLNIAFKNKKMKVNQTKLEGETAVIWGFKDEISPARIANQFSLKNENLKIFGGLFENKFIEKDRVLDLANLPSKQELYAKVAGSIAAPISGFVNVLQGNIKGLVIALNAISKSK